MAFSSVEKGGKGGALLPRVLLPISWAPFASYLSASATARLSNRIPAKVFASELQRFGIRFHACVPDTDTPMAFSSLSFALSGV
jgi:NAD(P)-dependent dehydrogenase (short-subunit alcohol dehydrogenase family)